MSKNPKNRPTNHQRNISMLRHYLAAFDVKVIGGSPDDVLEASEELYKNADEYPPGTNDKDIQLLWFQYQADIYRSPSDAPRGDKMLLYKIAAKTFNSQLKDDQEGYPLLGIIPSRLDEEPVTAGAIQRCLSRMKKENPEILKQTLDDWQVFSRMSGMKNEDTEVVRQIIGIWLAISHKPTSV